LFFAGVRNVRKLKLSSTFHHQPAGAGEIKVVAYASSRAQTPQNAERSGRGSVLRI
jgi:hypothetical protein